MKILLSIVVLFFTNVAFSQMLKKLPFVVPKANFKTDILNSSINNEFPDQVIVLEMGKDTGEVLKYKLWVYALSKNTFRYLPQKQKYYGYFTFKDHIVLIVSDDNASFFFTKLAIKMAFKFLSYPPYDIIKNPPAIIEPRAYWYEYTNNQFNLLPGI